MSKLPRQMMLRVAFTVMATTGLSVSRADVIQPTVVLPPAAGAYSLGLVCVDTADRCTANVLVSGFNIVSRTVENGNESVVVNATWSGDVFTESGGLPDTFLGRISFPGTLQFTYLGRDPSVNPLGTFVTELTDFHFQGPESGTTTVEFKQDPDRPSTGTTTIVPITVTPPINYSVSGSLDVFGLFSFNGAPFEPSPPRSATLTPIPEPGSALLAGFVLAGLIGIASRRRA